MRPFGYRVAYTTLIKITTKFIQKKNFTGVVEQWGAGRGVDLRFGPHVR